MEYLSKKIIFRPFGKRPLSGAGSAKKKKKKAARLAPDGPPSTVPKTGLEPAQP